MGTGCRLAYSSELYDDPDREFEYYMTQLTVPVGVPYFGGGAIRSAEPGMAKLEATIYKLREVTSHPLQVARAAGSFAS